DSTNPRKAPGSPHEVVRRQHGNRDDADAQKRQRQSLRYHLGLHEHSTPRLRRTIALRSGSRPMKARNISDGSAARPWESIVRTSASPVSLLNRPSLWNREKRSASRDS